MPALTTALLIAGGSALISGFGNWMNQRAEAEAATAQSGALTENQTAMTTQFNEFKDMMNPYVTAGNKALSAQQDLTGVNGPEAQEAAVKAISENPQLQEMMAQGENAMSQNAAATGGLRGGNFQGALAQYRPQMVNQAIDQRLGQLGGIINTGYNAAGQMGTAGMNFTGQMNNMNLAQAGLEGSMNPNFGESLLTGLGTGLGTFSGLGQDFGLFQPPGASPAQPTNPSNYNSGYGGQFMYPPNQGGYPFGGGY